MTSFLSITDADMMKATDAADALRGAVKGGAGPPPPILPPKTWTTVVQTGGPEAQHKDL